MVRKLSLAIAMALGVTPFGVRALGLGDIHLKSALNQSLNADIELLSAENEEVEDIRVKLASPDVFRQAGVERPYFLGRLKFKPERRADGKTVIRVTSKKPVREPFLDFLVEVNWPKGRMLREYTVLLDPPVTLERPPAPVNRPEIAATTRQRPVADDAQSGVATEYQPGAVDGYAPVHLNDTLWGIAKRLRQPGTTIEQMAMALFNANPRAFINRDINKLKANELLQVPGQGEVMALTSREARSAFLEQANARPLAAAPTAPLEPQPQPEREPEMPAAELKIATARPEAEATGTAGEGADQDATTDQLREDLIAAQEARQTALDEGLTLKSRVEELQVQLEQMQRLLTLKNDELARMQMTAGEEPVQEQPETGAGAAEDSGNVEAGETSSATGVEQAEADTEAQGEEPAADSDVVFVDEKATDEVVTETTQPAATPPMVEEPIELVPAAVTGAVQDESKAVEKAAAKPIPRPKKVPTLLERITADTTLMGVAAAAVLVVLALIWAIFRRRRSSPKREEFGDSILVNTLDEQVETPPEEALAATSPATDETSFLSDFSPSDIDALQDETGEVDPLAEADVYIAYGRYKQAEELVRQAIERDAQRLDLKLKLLEILFATRDADAYTALAQQLADQGMEQRDPKGWEQVLSMGVRLAPASALFAAAGRAATGAESDDVSVLEEELRGIGTLGVDDKAGSRIEADTMGSLDDLDLDLGELDGLDDLATLGGESLADSMEKDLTLSGGDFSDREEQDEKTLPGLQSAGAERDRLADGTGASEQPLQDDMILSLDDLEETVQGDLPGELELGETLNVSLDDLETPDGNADGTLSESLVDLEPAGQLDDASLEALEQELGLGQTPLDGASEENGVVDSTEALELPNNSELPLPEEVMVGDEVDTKLDLAQAYVEMGDAEGARSILDEVLSEGSEGQKQEAHKMLGQLSS